MRPIKPTMAAPITWTFKYERDLIKDNNLKWIVIKLIEQHSPMCYHGSPYSTTTALQAPLILNLGKFL